jgi:heterodisulfide reductase subunit B2
METTHYSYYPGCCATASAREYHVTTQLACKALGVELTELENWICCGASSAHSVDKLLGIALPANELQKAAQKGLPLVASCTLCFSRLKVAAHHLEDDRIRTAVSDILEQEIPRNPRYDVVNLLQVFETHRDRIPVKTPLKNLKVACYYGCFLSRPKEIAQFDDVENPQSMDRVVAALGGEPVEWGFKVECCGGSHIFTRPDIVERLSHRLLHQAEEAGADCIAVVCPVCHSNMDAMQKSIAARYKDKINIPVIYITQLIGLAAGLPLKSLLFDKLFVNPVPLLDSRGLI